jgi:hypothetical protein
MVTDLGGDEIVSLKKPGATFKVVNLYNPYPNDTANSTNHAIADTYIKAISDEIAAKTTVGTVTIYAIADAYTTFAGNECTYTHFCDTKRARMISFYLQP